MSDALVRIFLLIVGLFILSGVYGLSDEQFDDLVRSVIFKNE